MPHNVTSVAQTPAVRMPSAQMCSFRLCQDLFCISGESVQEIINPMPITKIPLAQPHILGLINIRGQIATCIDLRILFGLSSSAAASLFIVCKSKAGLFAFLVDEIGEVVDREANEAIDTPASFPPQMMNYIRNVYRSSETLTCEIDFELIADSLVTPTSKGEKFSE